MLSNLVNNLPATVISLPLIDGDPQRAYTLLAGVDVGPNLTLAGSLATLLWLAAARAQDADVSPRRLPRDRRAHRADRAGGRPRDAGAAPLITSSRRAAARRAPSTMA